MIVDASVLLSAFFPDEQQPASQMLIRDYVAGQITLVAPSLLGYEIANAVRQAERRERITQEQAESILLAYEGLQIRLQSVEWQQVLLLARHFNRPKPNVRVMKGNSVKMTYILHQKAFEIYALEASRVTDTSFVLAAFVCFIIYVIKQKLAQMPSLSHSDALNIQSNLWNYRAK